MRHYHLLLIFLIVFTERLFASSSSDKIMLKVILRENSELTEEIMFQNLDLRPNPLKQLFRQQEKKNRKVACAIMAFPFPFGIVGLHRIYMGTAPYVPIVYIGTLGGALGVLPMIDFIVILCKKNPEQFFGDRRVFMWMD